MSWNDANKLWQILEIALADLATCEADDAYEIDMNDWVRRNGKCKVCLAGACMVQTLHTDSFVSMSMADSNKLSALNNLRKGDVNWALFHLSGTYQCVGLDRFIPKYEKSHHRWWASMNLLLADLKEANV